MGQTLEPLRAFEAAARYLSFKKAALELSVTATAVSHQIKLLEESLDLPLFERLTRALASRPLLATAIAQGRLVAPFDIAVGQSHAYYLVIAESIVNRPAVMAFRDWLLEEARSEEPGRLNGT